MKKIILIVLFSVGSINAQSIIDSCSTSNYNGITNIRSGANTYVIQSFTGNSSALGSIKFYLYKSGSPTGNAYAVLYSHSGTYGTSSLPNSLLATSNAVDVSTLSTSIALVTFTFATPYTLTNGTYYVLGLKYEGGDGSNYLSVGRYLAGGGVNSAIHSGNMVIYSSPSWYVRNEYDLIFYTYSAATTYIPQITID